MGTSHLSRREFLLGVVATAPVLQLNAVRGVARNAVLAGVRGPAVELAAIESRLGGRLGVSAVDTGSRLSVSYRADERFPMCSTFKLLAVAAILKRVDDRLEHLDRNVPFAEKDLLAYAPVTRAHVKQGGMELSALCAAAIEYSDNTAANLILESLNGPANVTQFARSIGDNETRLDRNEPTLNSAIPGDQRDTTTPAAMMANLRAVLLGDVLSVASRALLTSWLIANTTGDDKLRASVPATWRVGDKTGSGQNGAIGDIAIMWPPSRNPILITAYIRDCSASLSDRNAAIKDAGSVVLKALG
ncbi:MAG: class A beta-lactamase [Gemmatimonadaceae bacterium]